MSRLKHRVGRPSNYRKSLQNDAWREVCSRVRMRDGHRCVFCGKRHSLEVHHKQYYINGMSIVGREADHLDCLVTLCADCHAAAHNKTS